jgi:hypothetical protein
MCRTQIERGRTVVHSVDSREYTAVPRYSSQQHCRREKFKMKRFFQLVCFAFLRTWNSQRFESLTFKLWAYFLLLTGIVAPLGQHRFCLRSVFEEWEHGWLFFPMAAVMSLIAFYQFGTPWVGLSYWLLWTFDTFSVPFLSYRGEK